MDAEIKAAYQILELSGRMKYFDFYEDEALVLLDGHFSISDLEAVLVILRDTETKLKGDGK